MIIERRIIKISNRRDNRERDERSMVNRGRDNGCRGTREEERRRDNLGRDTGGKNIRDTVED